VTGPTAAPQPVRVVWDVAVVDAYGRGRVLRIVARADRLVMLSPLGAGWTLPARADTVLVDALRQARVLAIQVHGLRPS
jgi:hypothetical protein